MTRNNPKRAKGLIDRTISVACSTSDTAPGCYLYSVPADTDLSQKKFYYVLRPVGGSAYAAMMDFELDMTARWDFALGQVGGGPIDALVYIYDGFLLHAAGINWESGYEFLYDYAPDGSARQFTMRTRFSF